MYRLASIAALGLSVLLFTVVAPATAADKAVITGKVIFKGDVKDPSIKRTVINTQKDPKCTKMKNGKKKKIGTVFGGESKMGMKIEDLMKQKRI